VDVSVNHIVTVIAHYSGGVADTVQGLIVYVAPEVTPIALPANLAVTIPTEMPLLTSRMPGYGFSPSLIPFDDFYWLFTLLPKSTAEYILSVGASIEYDLVNQDVFLVDGGFQQVIVRDPDFGGMYSIWYSSPVAAAIGGTGFSDPGTWSSYMHEMGHNATLNSPADYYFGGKTDGPANAILSETLAQIFQHATLVEMINHRNDYGLDDIMTTELKLSGISSARTLRHLYDSYVASGKPFNSWNDGGASSNEVLYTFGTIAYKFCEHAETSGQGYRYPTKRMMQFLQTFDADLHSRFDPTHDTAPADTFRATFMVSALSHAFLMDLRTEFRNLAFPIDDDLWVELASRPTAVLPEAVAARKLQVQNSPNPFGGATDIRYSLAKGGPVEVSIWDVSGRLVRRIALERQDLGPHVTRWDGRNDSGQPVSSGVYFCRIGAGGSAASRRMILMR
jgi:hypothetical protein